MSIVAEFTIPVTALPGGAVLESMPEIRIELERVVPTDDAILPYFWVFGTNADDFVTRMEAESEIDTLRVLTERDDVILFEAEWTPTAPIIDGITHLQATIMDATGTAERWCFQVRATDRERLATFQRLFNDQGIAIELNRIYDLSEAVEIDRRVTGNQRETLVTAYHEGYFDEPRQVTQQDLAEQFDISRRAVSSRLRRGIRNLVSTTLVDSGDSRRP